MTTDAIHQLFIEWQNLANDAINKIPDNAFTSEIQMIDPSVKPFFTRSIKMRKRKKIITNKLISTFRRPRTVVLKNCYPVSVGDSVDNGSCKCVVDVTFEFHES